MTDTIASRLAYASSSLRAGETAEAERTLRALLEEAGDNPQVWHLLGIIAGRAGRDADCVAALERAVTTADAAQRIVSGIALAEAHRRMGRLLAAKTVLRRVTADAPSHAEAWLRLGLLLREEKREMESMEPLRRAIALDPHLAVGHAALAATLHTEGMIEEAAASAERAVACAPGDPGFVATLAIVRNTQGRFHEAATLCRIALKEGKDTRLLNTLGIACRELGRIDEATDSFERACALQPDFPEALYNLATARKEQGRTDQAVALLRRVVALAPDLSAARFALCMAHLPTVYEDETEIARRRADYAAELEALIACAGSLERGALAQGVGAAQPFLLAAQGRDDVDLQRRYGTLVCRAMAEAYPPVPLASPPAPGERLRLGIVCGYFRDHSVWRIPTRGWVAGLDRSRFELLGYHTEAARDAESDRAEALFDRFVQGPMRLDAWRERIVDDRPHALIYPEIGMDPTAARLAALRLAPVQYASWGHPSTTGYPTIDYYLSSADMEPVLAEAAYSEILVRLPGLSAPVALPTLDEPIPSRVMLDIPEDAMVYWCGQSLHKYLPAHDDVLAAIATRVASAIFLFVEATGAPDLTARFQKRLALAFARQGLDSDRFCRFLPRLTPGAYRATMGCADAVLDSIGWSGCNTLLDALVHALPIVTWPGETMRSRHGAAILRALGLDHLVCRDRETYVRTAIALAGDGKTRSWVRDALEVGRLSLLSNEGAAALEWHLTTASQSVDPA